MEEEGKICCSFQAEKILNMALIHGSNRRLSGQSKKMLQTQRIPVCILCCTRTHARRVHTWDTPNVITLITWYYYSKVYVIRNAFDLTLGNIECIAWSQLRKTNRGHDKQKNQLRNSRRNNKKILNMHRRFKISDENCLVIVSQINKYYIILCFILLCIPVINIHTKRFD